MTTWVVAAKLVGLNVGACCPAHRPFPAGRHAAVLNVMIAHLPTEHPASETVQLQETLGHTPLQVVMGAAVGLLVGGFVLGLWSLM